MSETLIPDDATKPWIVAVLPKAEGEAALVLLKSHPQLSALSPSFRVQHYEEDHWYARSKNLSRGVWVMGAKGESAVKLPAAEPQSLADALRALLERLKRPLPGPGPMPPGPGPEPMPPAPVPPPAPFDWEKHRPNVMLALMALSVLLLLRKEPSASEGK